VLDLAIGRLARRFQDPTVDVEFPAMVAAADSAILDDAEFQ
jgi:hypothetical protein